MTTPSPGTATMDTLGVSVYHLQHVFLEECGDSSATIYKLEDLQQPLQPGLIRRKGIDVHCPLDKRPGAAYVHCLQGDDHVGPATHMLSYSWGNTIGDIVDTLVGFCSSTQQDPKRVYIWMCCLCVNQHRVVERAVRNQELSFEEFHQTFHSRVTGIGNLIAILAPWHDPWLVTRVWCIFELYYASENNCDIHILLPPKHRQQLEHDILHNDSITTNLYALYDILSNKARIQKAKASLDSDRQKILSIIESTVGYVALNTRVQKLLRNWIYELIQSIAKTRQPQDTIEYARFCERMGALFSKNNALETALEYYQKCLHIFQDPTDIATTYNHLANVLSSQGKHAQAIEHIQTCLKMEESYWGKGHLNTASIYSNLGTIQHAMGDTQGALESFQECVDIQELMLGPQHYSTAQSHNNIARVLEFLQDYHGALQHYHKCRCIWEGLLDHPSTASVFASIGTVLKAQGNLEGALQYHQRCLAIQANVLGLDHPQTAESYSNIGDILLQKGDFNGALDRFNKCLTIQVAELGKEHPETASTYNSIGDVLYAMGAHGPALPLFEMSLAIRMHALGKDHIDTAVVHSNLGMVLNQLGHYDHAVEHLSKCLAIEENTLGMDHPQTAKTYNNIGDVLRLKGDLDASLIWFRKAFLVLESVLGQDHPEIGIVHNNIGMVLHAKGCHVEALEHFEKCLAIWEPVVGKDHPNIASIYNCIGLVHRSKGDYHTSLMNFKKSFAIQELVGDDGGPVVSENDQPHCLAIDNAFGLPTSVMGIITDYATLLFWRALGWLAWMVLWFLKWRKPRLPCDPLKKNS